eukprot:310728-Pelagomonas_calceolata.AAC.1
MAASAHMQTVEGEGPGQRAGEQCGQWHCFMAATVAGNLFCATLDVTVAPASLRSSQLAHQ